MSQTDYKMVASWWHFSHFGFKIQFYPHFLPLPFFIGLGGLPLGLTLTVFWTTVPLCFMIVLDAPLATFLFALCLKLSYNNYKVGYLRSILLSLFSCSSLFLLLCSLGSFSLQLLLLHGSQAHGSTVRLAVCPLDANSLDSSSHLWLWRGPTGREKGCLIFGLLLLFRMLCLVVPNQLIEPLLVVRTVLMRDLNVFGFGRRLWDLLPTE